MIKAILFDMDGILYDSERFYLEGNYALLREFGYRGPKEALLGSVGCTMEEIYALYLDLLGHRITRDELLEGIERYYRAHPMNCRELIFPGVYETVFRLKEEGYLLACCSSSPLAAIMHSLEEMGIRSCFDYIRSGEQLLHAKPAPDIYLDAAGELGIAIDECVVYEDSDTGISAGKNAGMYVIARRDDRFHQKQTQADLLVKDIYELAETIRKENQNAGSHQN